MATRKSTIRRKAEPSPRIEDRPPTRAQQRKAQDQNIRAGAFAKPENRLVKRDPAETTTACRQVVNFLLYADVLIDPAAQTKPSSHPQHDHDLKMAKAYVYGTVADALATVESAIGGYWRDVVTPAAEVQS